MTLKARGLNFESLHDTPRPACLGKLLATFRQQQLPAKYLPAAAAPGPRYISAYTLTASYSFPKIRRALVMWGTDPRVQRS